MSDAGILQLKSEGHAKIDRLVELGYTKKRIYFILAADMNCLPSQAHFANSNNKSKLRRMVSILDKTISRRENYLKLQREKWEANQRKIASMSWYRRLSIRFNILLTRFKRWIRRTNPPYSR